MTGRLVPLLIVRTVPNAERLGCKIKILVEVRLWRTLSEQMRVRSVADFKQRFNTDFAAPHFNAECPMLKVRARRNEDGRCIAKRFGAIHVEPFRGGAVTVGKSFSME
jgi:hypothetical protein